MEAMCAGDGGVKQGECSDFFRAGYLQNDLNSWYIDTPASSRIFFDQRLSPL